MTLSDHLNDAGPTTHKKSAQYTGQLSVTICSYPLLSKIERCFRKMNSVTVAASDAFERLFNRQLVDFKILNKKKCGFKLDRSIRIGPISTLSVCYDNLKRTSTMIKNNM